VHVLISCRETTHFAFAIPERRLGWRTRVIGCKMKGMGFSSLFFRSLLHLSRPDPPLSNDGHNLTPAPAENGANADRLTRAEAWSETIAVMCRHREGQYSMGLWRCRYQSRPSPARAERLNCPSCPWMRSADRRRSRRRSKERQGDKIRSATGQGRTRNGSQKLIRRKATDLRLKEPRAWRRVMRRYCWTYLKTRGAWRVDRVRWAAPAED
jgi:hypothetical protein